MRSNAFALLAVLVLVTSLAGCSALRDRGNAQPATSVDPVTGQVVTAQAPKSRFARFRENVGKRFRLRPEAQTAFGGVQTQANDPSLAMEQVQPVAAPMSSAASLSAPESVGQGSQYQSTQATANAGFSAVPGAAQSGAFSPLPGGRQGATRGSAQLTRLGLGLSPGLAGQTRGSASPYGNLRDTLASAGGYTRSAEGDGRIAPVQPLKSAYIPLRPGTRSADEAALLGPAADVIGDTRPVAGAPIPASPLAAEEQRLQAYIAETRNVEALPQAQDFYADLTAIGIANPADMQPVINGETGASAQVDLGGMGMKCSEFATAAEANAFFESIGAGRPC